MDDDELLVPLNHFPGTLKQLLGDTPTGEFLAHLPEDWPEGVPLPSRTVTPEGACYGLYPGYFWDTPLENEQRNRMSRYLSAKFGIPL